jgi:hypothetical protein
MYPLLIIIIIFILIKSKPSSSKFEKVDVIDYVYKLYDKFKNRFTLNTNTFKLNSVDMVYAIAMPQRINYITEQINTMGLQCKYLNAITPDDFKEYEKTLLSDVNKLFSSLYGLNTRLAVLFSFIMCYIDAIKNGYQTIIVFEDDIIINVSLDTLNKATTEFVNSDNDIFYMGYCFLNCKQTYREEYTYLKGLTDPSILCGHATCIKTKILPALINYSFPMKKPSDEIFTEYFIRNKIRACVPKSVYFDQVDRKTMKSLNESTNVLKHCRN